MGERTPVLVKIPAETLARIETHASDQGLNRMAAILSLLVFALDAWELPEEPASPKKSEVARVRAPIVAAPVAKPKLDTSSVGVLDPAARRAEFLAGQKGKK